MRYLLYLMGCWFCTAASAQFYSPTVDSLTMRDGNTVVADRYLAGDSTAKPTILIQTPYNRQAFRNGLPLGVFWNLQNAPFHFVIADWRGFYGSAAAAVPQYDRGLDGADIIAWIVQQPWSDGQVITWGGSALGQIQYQTAAHKPAGLVGIMPMVADPRTSYAKQYHDGVMVYERLVATDSLGFGLSPFVRDYPLDGLAWDIATAQSDPADSIAVPVLSIAGWYDFTAELQLAFFQDLLQRSDSAVRNQHKLLIGPWAHGNFRGQGPGADTVGQLAYPNAAGWHDTVMLDFIEKYAFGEAAAYDSYARYQVFDAGQGPSGRTWRGCSEWPCPSTELDTLRYILYPDSTFRFQAVEAPDSDSFSFTSDPRNPTPTIGGPNLDYADTLGQGPYDQRQRVEGRSDVLVFTSENLASLIIGDPGYRTILGQIRVELPMSFSCPDADVMVRLTDVFPDGRSMLIRQDAKRVRMRNGNRAADTALAEPDSVYLMTLDLMPIEYSFAAGHRFRLIVSATNWPHYDLNPQTGDTLQTPGDTVSCTCTLHTSAQKPARVSLPHLASVSRADAQETGTARLGIFPNPSSGDATLRAAPRTRVRVFDIIGRPVGQVNVGANGEAQLPELQPGLYLLRSEDGATARWVVQ